MGNLRGLFDVLLMEERDPSPEEVPRHGEALGISAHFPYPFSPPRA